jgi:hypothetical protein
VKYLILVLIVSNNRTVVAIVNEIVALV